MSRLFALRKKLAVYLLAACVCAGIFIIAPRSINARIKSIAVINVSSWERLNLWRESLSIAEDFPVFGSGLNTYSAIAKEYKITPIGGIYPHNSFLHMLAESGVVGLTAFIILVGYGMGIALQALRSTNNSFVLGILAGIVSFLVQSFFDVNLYALQLAIFFWFMLGLLVSASRLDWQT
jgi:O-antigen ligase